MSTQVLSFPPQSFVEMTEAISAVAAKKAFFGRDLFLLSKEYNDCEDAENDNPNIRIIRAKMVIADIASHFFNLLSSTPKNHETQLELIRFQKAFSEYKNMIQQERYPISLVSLIESVQYSIEKVVKRFNTVTATNDNSLPLLLITDLDGSQYSTAAPGAMTIRAMRYLNQGIPVIMPYQLLCSIINYSFYDSQYFRGESDDILKSKYLINAQQVCSNLANSQLWSLYKSAHSNLVAILPPQYVPMLNLQNYQPATFDDVKEEAILNYIGKSHSAKIIEADQIVDILTSETCKHVVWAGHGGLDTVFSPAQAMGLSLPKVTEVLSRATNVNFWDLHSCFLLGNIRKIMAEVQQRNAIVMVNNGAICESSPPKENSDSINAYFILASQVIDGQEAKIQKKLARIFALKNGFELENHPHLILKDSKKITPLSYPKFIANVSSFDKDTIQAMQRLYIDKLITDETLQLSQSMILLPGLAELHAPFLLSEITTPLPFADFILKSFRQKYQGNTLFMVAKINCADGVYERVIYCSDKEKPKTFYCQNGDWFAFDVNAYYNKKYFNGQATETQSCEAGQIQEKFQEALNLSALSPESFREHGMEAAEFYSAVRIALQLPESFFTDPQPPMRLEHGTKEYIMLHALQHDEVSHCVLCSREEASFFQAIALQNKEAIANFTSEIPLDTLKQAMTFCIQRNLLLSFRYLLEAMNKIEQEIRIDPSNKEFSSQIEAPLGQQSTALNELLEVKTSLIISCIKMKRPELLKQLDCYPYPKSALSVVAKSGTPEIFSIVKEKCNNAEALDYAKFMAMAENNENWEMVHFLSTNP